MSGFMTALSVGQSFMKYVDDQNKANQQEVLHQTNRLRATQARDLKIQSLNTRLQQEAEVASATKLEAEIAALKKQERAIVAAGETDVAGKSVDILIDSFEAQKLRGDTIVNANVKAIENEIALQRRGADAETEARVNSIPRGQYPSMLASAASAGASAVSTYYSGLDEDAQDIFLEKYNLTFLKGA